MGFFNGENERTEFWAGNCVKLWIDVFDRSLSVPRGEKFPCYFETRVGNLILAVLDRIYNAKGYMQRIFFVSLFNKERSSEYQFRWIKLDGHFENKRLK